MVGLSIMAALAALGATAVAQPPSSAGSIEPVKLSAAQLDQIVAGNPNIEPNGSNSNSNGASGAPGNSFKGGDGNGSPGQTGNPHPGR